VPPTRYTSREKRKIEIKRVEIEKDTRKKRDRKGDGD
jgi:hypothetical protein